MPSEISVGMFSVVGIIMLSVLIIAFCSAHAQSLRTQKLEQNILKGNDTPVLSHHPKDYFDFLQIPSLTRMVPLAQILRGDNQFFKDKDKNSPFMICFAGAYYFVLKIIK